MKKKANFVVLGIAMIACLFVLSGCTKQSLTSSSTAPAGGPAAGGTPPDGGNGGTPPDGGTPPAGAPSEAPSN